MKVKIPNYKIGGEVIGKTCNDCIHLEKKSCLLRKKIDIDNVHPLNDNLCKFFQLKEVRNELR